MISFDFIRLNKVFILVLKTLLCIPAKLTPHSGKLTPHCLRLSIAYPTVKVIYFFSWIHL